jgi:lipopolysaccharide/colanic/teichoic acid biosynthesis glycosyltransferase/glycosyltransferase involved in cell wall biosynthesis
MKILILTQWFDPEPTFKGLLFARELAARGHEVEVLTGFPNYPGGEVYPGYRIRPWVREQIDGINVLRLALYPSHNSSGFHRALNYISFALSAAVIGTALIRKPDVVYVYHPPITVGFAAAVIGFIRRTPFVYDIQDLWPDTVTASGMMSNPAALTLLGKLCKFIYRRARHITVPSRGFKEQLVGRGVPPDKIDVIYNWCDETALKHDCRSVTRLGATNRFCILFAGTMGLAQGLDSVLRAAQICRTAVPAAEFLFIGGGVERRRLESTAKEMRLANVKFLPRQPMHAMGSILAGADALVVHLKDDPLFRITIPSKTQAYLATGKPILMGVRGDAADLVKQSCAGVVCEPGNPHSIAEAVKTLVHAGPQQLAAMGHNGRAFYDRELSVSIGVGNFDRIFNKIVLGIVPAGDIKALTESVGKLLRNRAMCTNMGDAGRNWMECSSRPDIIWQAHAEMYRGMLGEHSRRVSRLSLRAKRAFDLLAAMAALIVLSPLLAAIVVVGRLSLGSPVLFRQRRPGSHGQLFTCLKFRTMTDARDANGQLLPDMQRLTPLGRFLRSTSLDELPELFNVIRGEMSLVGPRPLLPQYLNRYSSEQMRRHEVKPGITGWAQVNGRNALDWNRKFELDLWYVDHWSLWLDLKILARTAGQVVRCVGISRPGHATMPEFMGISTEREQGNA